MIVTIDTNVVINACKENSWDHIDVLSLIRALEPCGCPGSQKGRSLLSIAGTAAGIELFEKWDQEIWEQRVSAGIGTAGAETCDCA